MGGCLKMKKTTRTINIFIVFIFSLSFGFSALGDNIQSYWTLDNVLSDSVGSRTLTNNGATYSSSGKINGAFDFDGTNDYMTAVISNDVSTSNAFSVSLWFNADSTVGTQQIYVSADTANDRIILNIVDGELIFSTYDGSTTTGLYTPVSSGVWYHVVISSDGVSYRMVVNDAIITNTHSYAGASIGGSLVYIGANPTGGAQWFNGRIDEIGTWTRQITISEISQLYNGGTGLQYPFTTIIEPLLNILNITANGETFANNTEFDVNDIIFNITYQVNNSDIGNFTNSTIITLNDLNNGEYSQFINVSYNNTWDAINISFSVNVTLPSTSITTNFQEIYNTNSFSTTLSSTEDWDFILGRIYINGTTSQVGTDIPYCIFSGTPCEINTNYTPTIPQNAVFSTKSYYIDIWARNNTDGREDNITIYFKVDVDNPIISHNIPLEINTYNLTGIEINVTDTNPDTCMINIDSISYSCSSFTGHTFSTNGYKNWSITSTDKAGNTEIETGTLLINPDIYIYFNDANGTQITDFYLNGTLYSDYATLKLYDYGLGTHKFEFSKIGFDTLTFNINFASTGYINQTTVVGAAKINIFIYDRTSRTLITGTNVTIELAGSYGYSGYTTTGEFTIINSGLVPGSYSLLFYASGYNSESKTLTYTNQEEVNISIYMLQSNMSETGILPVYVEDGFGVGLENVLVKLNEWKASEGAFITTSEKFSQHPFGKVAFNVEYGTKLYRICAYPDSGEVYCHDDVIVTSSTDDIYIPILGNDFINSLFTHDYSAVCSNTTISGGTKFDFTFADDKAVITKFCMEVFQKTQSGTKTKVDEMCSENYEGSLTKQYTHGNTTTLIMKGYAYIGNISIPVCEVSSNQPQTLGEAVDDYGLDLILPILFALFVVGFGLKKEKYEWSAIGLVVLLWLLAFSFKNYFTVGIASAGTIILIIAGAIVYWRNG